MQTCERTNESPVSIKEVLELRKQQDAYYIFYKTFLPVVCKKTVFDENLLDTRKKKEKNVVTYSDEAFALLCFENYYEWYCDIYQHWNGQPPNKNGKKKVWESDVRPPYSRGGGIMYSNGKKETGRGWLPSGVARFNELYDMVRQNRKQYPNFFNYFRTHYLGEQKVPKTGTKRKREGIPLAHNDFEASSDSESEGNNQYLQPGEDSSTDEEGTNSARNFQSQGIVQV